MNILKSTLFLLGTLISSQCLAWTEVRNWEGVTPGAKLTIGNGDNYVQAMYEPFFFGIVGDNSRAQLGSKSIKIHHVTNAGNNSWGMAPVICAASHNIPAQGSELWARGYLYWPSDFKFNKRPKIMRISSSVGDWIFGDGGGGEGHDLFIQGVGTWSVWPHSGKPFPNPPAGSSGGVVNGSLRITNGQWNQLQMYIKFSKNASEGKLRFWLNGNLMYDITTVTMGSYALPSGACKDPVLAFYANWENPSPPADQYSWLDNVVMTTDPSVAYSTDSKGYKMIGDSGVTPTPAPSTTVTCRCTANPNVPSCTLVPRTSRKYKCSGQCPSSCIKL